MATPPPRGPADPAPSRGPSAPRPGEPATPTEAELREVVLRGEALRQQLAALEQQRELVLDLHADARRALATLEHLEQAKEGDEALLPLGAGAYAYARLDKPGRAVASLGAGVSAEMPVGDARARMGERVESLDAAMQQLNRDVARVSDELARLNALLEQVYGGA